MNLQKTVILFLGLFLLESFKTEATAQTSVYKQLDDTIIPDHATLLPKAHRANKNFTGMSHLKYINSKIIKGGGKRKTKRDAEKSLAAIADFTELLMSGRLQYSGGLRSTYGIRDGGPTKEEWRSLVKIAGLASQYLNRVFMSKNQPLKNRITQRVFIHAFMSLTPEERLQLKYQGHSLGVLALLCAGGAAAHGEYEWKERRKEFIQIGIDEARKIGNAHLKAYMDKLEELFKTIPEETLEKFFERYKDVDFYTVANEGIHEY